MAITGTVAAAAKEMTTARLTSFLERSGGNGYAGTDLSTTVLPPSMA
jgi:hypothetical protein